MIIRCVPRRVGHAVAPGVEMGLLDGVLVLVHDLFPAAEMVGEDVVEAVGGAVPHKDGHHVATGADVVELACDTAAVSTSWRPDTRVTVFWRVLPW